MNLKSLDTTRDTSVINSTSQTDQFNSLVEVINSCAHSRNKIYWHEKDTQIDTYSSIQADALYLSRSLLKNIKSQRIGLVAFMNRDFIIRFFACQYAGIIPVILPTPNFNLAQWQKKITKMLKEACCNILWINDNENIEDFPENRQYVLMTDPAFLLDRDNQSSQDNFACEMNDIAYIQFTSGTTGEPKAISITQKALMINIQETLLEGLSLTSQDRAISWLPFYHDMGLVGFFLAPFYAKCELHYLSTRQFLRNPIRWLTLISEYQLTIAYAPNFAYERLSQITEDKIPKDLSLKSWRVAGIGAEKVKRHTLESFFERYKAYSFDINAFYPSYGMAESVLAISIRNPDKPLFTNGSREISCGEILPNLTHKISHDGEILIKGEAVTTHYANGKAIPRTHDGYFLTGDLGFYQDGQLYITGRKKECIIVNGRNLWPTNIEASLSEMIATDIAYLVTPITFKDKEIVGIILAKNNWETDEMKQVSNDCSAIIFEEFGVSSRCFFITQKSLLKTSSGKPARLAIANAIQHNEIIFKTI